MEVVIYILVSCVKVFDIYVNHFTFVLKWDLFTIWGYVLFAPFKMRNLLFLKLHIYLNW